MFSDNGMISPRQLKRQMVLSFLGVLLLLGTGEAAGGGGNALLGFFLGILLLLAYLFLLVRTAEVYRAPEKYLGLPGKWLLTGGYLSYLALSGGVLLEEISRVVQIYLLPSVPQPVIGAVFLGAAFLGMGQKIQKRGRLAEVSYPWVLGIFLLLLLLSVPHLHGIPAEGMEPWKAREVSRAAVQVLASGTAVSLLPFILGRVREQDACFRVLRRGIWLLALITLGTAGILVGVYGWKGVQQLEYPILNLMTGTGIPGGVLGRVDILWLAVLLFTLLFAMGSILFYGAWIGVGESRGIPWRRLLLAAGIWLLSLIRWRENTAAKICGRLLRDVWAPALLGITLLAVWAKRRVEHGTEKKTN